MSEDASKDGKPPKVLLDLELKRPRMRPRLDQDKAGDKPTLELQYPPRSEREAQTKEELEDLVPETMKKGFYRSSEDPERVPPSIELQSVQSETPPPVPKEPEVEPVLAVEPEPESGAEEAPEPEPLERGVPWGRYLGTIFVMFALAWVVAGLLWPPENSVTSDPSSDVTLDQIAPHTEPTVRVGDASPEVVEPEPVEPAAVVEPEVDPSAEETIAPLAVEPTDTAEQPTEAVEPPPVPVVLESPLEPAPSPAEPERPPDWTIAEDPPVAVKPDPPKPVEPPPKPAPAPTPARNGQPASDYIIRENF
ncbi:MAG: hypothetical protein AB7S38_10550 [Vulcanimicrobiota bacterium]